MHDVPGKRSKGEHWWKMLKYRHGVPKEIILHGLDIWAHRHDYLGADLTGYEEEEIAMARIIALGKHLK